MNRTTGLRIEREWSIALCSSTLSLFLTSFFSPGLKFSLPRPLLPRPLLPLPTSSSSSCFRCPPPPPSPPPPPLLLRVLVFFLLLLLYLFIYLSIYSFFEVACPKCQELSLFSSMPSARFASFRFPCLLQYLLSSFFASSLQIAGNQAAMWDLDMVQKISAATALEGRILQQINYRNTGGGS